MERKTLQKKPEWRTIGNLSLALILFLLLLIDLERHGRESLKLIQLVISLGLVIGNLPNKFSYTRKRGGKGEKEKRNYPRKECTCASVHMSEVERNKDGAYIHNTCGGYIPNIVRKPKRRYL